MTYEYPDRELAELPRLKMGCSFSPSVSVGGDGADIVIGLDEAEVEVGAAAGPHLLQVLQGGGLVVGDVELAHLHEQLRGQLGQVVVAEAEVVQPRVVEAHVHVLIEERVNMLETVGADARPPLVPL